MRSSGSFVLNLETDISKNILATTSKVYIHESTGQVSGAPFKLDAQKTLKLRAKRQAGGGGASTLMAYIAGHNVDNDL